MKHNSTFDAAQFVLESTKARSVSAVMDVQSLWSGYGSIVRYTLTDSDYASVVLKHVNPGDHSAHPRGWDSDTSNQRKLKSYEVESLWYRRYAPLCGSACRVPNCISTKQLSDGETLLLLEDLDAHYPTRHDSLSLKSTTLCLKWLAHFHATFLDHDGQGLWPVGTYWHLGTRADEYHAMVEGPIKQAAYALDAKLNNAVHQTLVHGDAKVANFCFANNDSSVAAVDFQYVGRGCGIKDVVYLLGSCLSGADIGTHESYLLDAYFGHLRDALSSTLNADKTTEIEAEWRSLYSIAWTDFYRFLLGWNPGHWKIDQYTKRQSTLALNSLP